MDNNLGFDADFYLNNGNEVKSIDARMANSFKDICEFLKWKADQSNKTEILIEKLNGEKITIKRTKM